MVVEGGCIGKQPLAGTLLALECQKELLECPEEQLERQEELLECPEEYLEHREAPRTCSFTYLHVFTCYFAVFGCIYVSQRAPWGPVFKCRLSDVVVRCRPKVGRCRPKVHGCRPLSALVGPKSAVNGARGETRAPGLLRRRRH